MIYFTSDHHFGHKNIIAYTSRPFKDVHHMNVEMTRRWNETVSPEDTVYHLGDFAFGSWDKYLPALNGKIHFIRGNHDPIKHWKNHREHIVNQAFILLDGLGVFLCHYPAWKDRDGFGRTWPADYKAHYKVCDLLLYGHTHNSPEPDRPANAIRVCVEDWDYRPVAWPVLREKYLTQTGK